MILWRLVPAPLEKTALDGVGAALHGGRWNSKGLPAVYLSVDSATTILETLTTFSRSTEPPDGYRLLQVEYLGSVFEPLTTLLPANWDRHDDASAARTFGDQFLRASEAGVMLVPCAFLKSAMNAVLNTNHPDAVKAKVTSASDFRFDPRWPIR